jgi:hypothetical protein
MREPHACQAKNSERMLFFEPIYSSLFLKFAIPVLKTLSLSLPTAPKRAKSVEVGLAAPRDSELLLLVESVPTLPQVVLPEICPSRLHLPALTSLQARYGPSSLLWAL